MCELCERIKDRLNMLPNQITHAAIVISTDDDSILHIEGYDHEPTSTDFDDLIDTLQRSEDIALTHLVHDADYFIVRGRRADTIQ